ncbi:sulfatase-like hydrolase/transferase, partial [Candidatus Sumerlaeota bacterium]|nr:sulfatase-like hydrolase/transferase [Candidatus Sumerlaeota bacterium]
GYERQTAPALARMAQEGTLLKITIAQATWTKVSTPSILTSLYPSSHTVKQTTDRLPNSAVTLAEVFRDAGYATLSFSSVQFTGRSANLHQGFEVLHEAASRTGEKQSKSAREYVDRLLPWLEVHRDVPFFVFLHVFDPHSPFEPRPPFDTLWADPAKKEEHEKQLDAAREFITSPFLRRLGMPDRAHLEEAGVDPEPFINYFYDWYDGSIRGMDTEIGRLLERLDELGLTEKTLVVFIGDHGEEFFEHGKTWHGHTVYGELTNVPMILRRPGDVAAGVVVEETVRTIDLFPTILELSGLAAPEGIQGQSLLPLFSAAASESGGEWIALPAVSEKAAGPPNNPSGSHESYALIAEGWRLIHNTIRGDDLPEFELYDEAKDPLNAVNVAEDHPDIVERLSAEMEIWRSEVEAGKLISDEEMIEGASAEELKRLRSLGYLQ